jgi:hypothetical protein
VTAEFYCCEKKCTKFEPDSLVQLGYNGVAAALVFRPEIDSSGMRLPERGSIVEDKQLRHLSPLKVAQGSNEQKMDLSIPRGLIVH